MSAANPALTRIAEELLQSGWAVATNRPQLHSGFRKLKLAPAYGVRTFLQPDGRWLGVMLRTEVSGRRLQGPIPLWDRAGPPPQHLVEPEDTRGRGPESPSRCACGSRLRSRQVVDSPIVHHSYQHRVARDEDARPYWELSCLSGHVLGYHTSQRSADAAVEQWGRRPAPQ